MTEREDKRPKNCRFRLQDEGNAYPRSSCQACGKGVLTGLGNKCSKEADMVINFRENGEFGDGASMSSADVDRLMMEESERYVQNRFPQMILQDVGQQASRSFFDAAQMRAAFRSGYDYANKVKP